MKTLCCAGVKQFLSGIFRNTSQMVCVLSSETVPYMTSSVDVSLGLFFKFQFVYSTVSFIAEFTMFVVSSLLAVFDV